MECLKLDNIPSTNRFRYHQKHFADLQLLLTFHGVASKAHSRVYAAFVWSPHTDIKIWNKFRGNMLSIFAVEWSQEKA